jgi:hypothetical protein
VGVIRCTRCDTLNVQWAVRNSSIRSASVGELIFFLLSHAQSTTTQSTLHVLPSTTFQASYRQRELPLSQHSTYPNASSSTALSIILDFVFIPGTIYQTPYFLPHLNDSSTANIGVLLVGSFMDGKKLGQRQQQEQLLRRRRKWA